MAKLGVLVVHGMGNQRRTFAYEMIEEISRRLEKNGYDENDIIWKTVYWAPVIKQREDKLLDDLNKEFKLGYPFLREFVVSSLTDVIAYQQVKTAHQDVDLVAAVDTEIQKMTAELYQDLRHSSPETTEFPMVVMAHSLGCQMISNYIWDAQHNTNPAIQAASSFERMQNLAGIITFGNNMPLFSIVYNKLVPVAFPGPGIQAIFQNSPPADIRKACQWLNFYDKDDILGYPIKMLSSEYNKTVSEDIALNAGGLFTQWNPFSHSMYWTDNNMTRRVVSQLENILKLVN